MTPIYYFYCVYILNKKNVHMWTFFCNKITTNLSNKKNKKEKEKFKLD